MLPKRWITGAPAFREVQQGLINDNESRERANRSADPALFSWNRISIVASGALCDWKIFHGE